jgi:hypothetical protein
MQINLTIATKLAIAYSLFLAPIGYLGYQMIANKESSIEFARKETLGVRYIAEVRGVQDAVVRDADMIGLVERVKANETANGAASRPQQRQMHS